MPDRIETPATDETVIDRDAQSVIRFSVKGKSQCMVHCVVNPYSSPNGFAVKETSQSRSSPMSIPTPVRPSVRIPAEKSPSEIKVPGSDSSSASSGGGDTDSFSGTA
jgi:hypothetical protein